MKIDINDNQYRSLLKNAAKTPHGKIIVDYLTSCVSKLDYDTISSDKVIQEIGQEFLVMREVRKNLKNIINQLTSE